MTNKFDHKLKRLSIGVGMLFVLSLSSYAIVSSVDANSNTNSQQKNVSLVKDTKSHSEALSSKAKTGTSTAISIETGVDSNNAVEKAKEEKYEGKEGDYGRLFIPNLKLSVALNTTPWDSTSAQSVIDAEDSAVTMVGWDGGPGVIISDHNYQGFQAITNVKVGDSMFIKKGNVVTEYVADHVGQGTRNSSGYIYDVNGEDITEHSGVTLYTCNPDASHPYIVHYSAK